MAAKRRTGKADKKRGAKRPAPARKPARPSKKKATKKPARAPRPTSGKAAREKSPSEKHARRKDYGASVDEFVARLPPNEREIVNALREMVRDAVPGVMESIRWGMPVFARKKLICYASPKSDYVRFGFYARVDLDDPDQRIAGALAYVKLHDVSDIERPLLQNWIRQIVDHTGA